MTLFSRVYLYCKMSEESWIRSVTFQQANFQDTQRTFEMRSNLMEGLETISEDEQLRRLLEMSRYGANFQ